MKNKFILVEDLIQNFNLNIVHQGSKENKIFYSGFNRTGIEMASRTTIHKQITTSVLWSANEYTYLKKLSEKERSEVLNIIFNLKPPIIFLTKGFVQTDFLLDDIKKYNTTIVSTNLTSDEIYVAIGTFISLELSECKTLHGTLVVIYGVGVLLTGESGIGKSEIALELVKKGHLFVGDDAIDVVAFGNNIIGKANKVANKFIEVRGLGILNMGKMFGIEKLAESSNVNIVVELQPWDQTTANDFERIGNVTKYESISGIKVVKYILPITPGRKISELVEAAVVDYKLKKEGYNSGEEYIENYRMIQEEGK